MRKLIKDDEPLPSHTKLKYFECYAKIVLEDMFPKIFFNLKIKDKPDLQNNISNIGVEVTSSVDKSHKEAEALYAEWSYKEDCNRNFIEKQIKKCGAKIEEGILIGKPGEDSFLNVIKQAKLKVLKLNKYSHFTKQYLFIFSDILADKHMLDSALEELREICDRPNSFDCIFVLVPEQIYIFDLIKNKWSVRAISNKKQYEHGMIAREMVILEENK
ncbi:hypothetical protein lbkm_1094 [Lachnospiraceae bacterium KM106-2]|nr:hypothetical protein lbkm_1094 [Lachnospiraceae bacterium KM106-2]